VGAWKERNFRLLFIGRTTSAFGNMLVPVALAFAVLDLTGSASSLGEVLGVQAIARVVFLLAGGVIADRISRLAVMLCSDVVRGAAYLMLGLLLVTRHPSVLTVTVLAAVTGMAGATFTPAAAGLLPALVNREYLQQANALLQASSAATQIAGPAAAGLCVVTVGPGWAIIADAGTFFVNVAALSLIQFSHVPRAAGRKWLRDLHDGWKDFWGRQWFRDTVLGASVFNLLYAMYSVLAPVVSQRFYGGADAWVTAAIAAGIGSVLAGLVATRLRPRHPLRLAVPVSGLFSLSPLAFGARLPLPVIAAACLIGGSGFVIFTSLWQTSVQRHVPEHLLSRANSYDWFASQVMYPAGLAIAGPVAGAAGLRPVLLAAAVLVVVETAVLMIVPSVRNLSDRSAAAVADVTDTAAQH
jgi:MFS family permease